MTEVPDHLLQRSLERRAALGGGDAGGGAPTPAASGGGDAPTAATPARAEAAAAPAVIVEAAPPPPPPPYVQAALDRKKVPSWMAVVGVAAMLWAFIYAGVMFSPAETISDPEVAQGEEIYQAQCSGCHGAEGQGGTGRQLASSVTATFPDMADHIAWVTNGSTAAGTPYGNPDRPGGQHIAQSQGFGKMPAFGAVLSEEEIRAVVRFEREVLDDADPAADQEASAGGSTGSTGGEDTGDSPSGDDQTGITDSEGGDTGGDSGASTTSTTSK